jgi:hypothetical protein
MKTSTMQRISWVVGMLLVLLLALLVNGCDREHRNRHLGSPDTAQPKDISLTMTNTSERRTKATGYYIKAVGVDDAGNEIWPSIGPLEIENPTFPLSTPITLFVPPCLYRITIGVNLVREPDREKSAVFDVCENSTIDLSILTFEEFRIYENPLRIHTSNPVKGGESVEVSCGTDQFSAPDSDRWPLRVEIWEEGQNGEMVNGIKGPFDPYDWFTATFPDPFPLSSFEEERVFKCFIKDGRSPSETFDEPIQRIPPCLVLNDEDSGEGSLRQVLEDAEENECRTIKFASGVSTITLSSQLTVPNMTVTIDGGAGVTTSGNNSTRVFWVNGGADVTFQSLTITNGNTSGNGGGMYNNGGTVIIANSTVNNSAATNDGGGMYSNGGRITLANCSTVSGNTATNDGGSIYNNGGTVFVNGTVSNRTAGNWGGGIYNNGGRLTVNGTVSNSTAGAGGGIFNTAGGTVFVNGTVRHNLSNGGGGIANVGTLTVNGRVSGNRAIQSGGGIDNVGGGTVIVNGTVSGNIVTGFGFGGGGIANWPAGTLSFGINNLIQGNGAPIGGGILNNGVALPLVPPNPPRNYGTGNTPGGDCSGTGCP